MTVERIAPVLETNNFNYLNFRYPAYVTMTQPIFMTVSARTVVVYMENSRIMIGPTAQNPSIHRNSMTVGSE
eukprot:374149-Amphidinium_carterae.1